MLDSKESILSATVLEKDNALAAIDEITAAKKDIESKAESLLATIEELEEEKNSLTTNQAQNMQDIENMKQQLEEVNKSYNELEASLDTALNEKRNLEKDKANVDTELQEIKSLLESRHVFGGARDSTLPMLECLISEHKAAKDEINSLLFDKKSRANKDKHDTNELNSMKHQLEEVNKSYNELKIGLEAALFAEGNSNNSLKASDIITDLPSLVSNMRIELILSREKVDDLLRLNKDLNSSLSAVQNQLNEVNLELKELKEIKCDSKGESTIDLSDSTLINTLRNENEEKMSLINELKFTIEHLQAEVDNSNSKVMDCTLNGTDTADKGCVSELDSLRSEISELKQLLADANRNVDEAREEVMASDRELEEKERDLEVALQIASERDEAARLLTDKVEELEKRIFIGSEQDDANKYEELMKDMELLLEEKMELEITLEEEIKTRKQNEDAMKYQMEEEQRALVSEAEHSMNKLRAKLAENERSHSEIHEEIQSLRKKIVLMEAQLKEKDVYLSQSDNVIKNLRQEISALKQSENNLRLELSDNNETSIEFKNQVYAAKEEFDIKIKKLNDVIHEKSLMVQNAHTVIETHKKEIECLQREKDYLKSQVQSVRQSFTREKELLASKLKEELASLRVTLTQTEGEAYSAKKEARDFKEQLRRLKTQSSSVSRKIADETEKIVSSLRDRLAKSEADKNDVDMRLRDMNEKVKNTNECCDQLKLSISSLQQNNERLNIQLQERNSLVNKMKERDIDEGMKKSFELKLKEMEVEVKEKNNRIKMLEKVRLTKEQCAALKKMKVSRPELYEFYSRL